MDPLHEVKLKCLELAMTQAKLAGSYGNIKSVEEISTEFYNHIVGQDQADPEPEAERAKQKPGRKPKDKAVGDLFT